MFEDAAMNWPQVRALEAGDHLLVAQPMHDESF